MSPEPEEVIRTAQHHIADAQHYATLCAEADAQSAQRPPAPSWATTPSYVHSLLDALLRQQPIDFAGQGIPDDVRERLESWEADKKRLAAERDTDFTDSHVLLISRIAKAVSEEFEHALGIRLGANRDDTWLKAGDGIAFNMGLQHVGWYHEEGERAHMFVRADLYPVPPDDGRDWHPVYVLA